MRTEKQIASNNRLQATAHNLSPGNGTCSLQRYSYIVGSGLNSDVGTEEKMKTRWKILLAGFVVGLISLGANAGGRAPEIVRYYDQWIGCKAPPIQFDQSDRIQYAEPNYNGKRVLLYSFDAGNFCDAPNMPALLKELTALQNARAAAAGTLYVIGYTRGLMWSR